MYMIALCDDNPKALRQYSDLITKLARKHNLDIMISSFSSGEQLMFHLAESPNSEDIIFLDVLMVQANGIDTAKELRHYGSEAAIVFLSSSEDYVFDAFDVSPVHYLLKESTSLETFEQVFLRAVDIATQKATDMLTYEAGNAQKMIPIKDIAFIEIWRRIITVHHRGTEIDEFYGVLDQMEEQLKGKDFVRVHRSYLVHLPYIAKFEAQRLLLTTGAVIPIGVTYLKRVQACFSDYVARSNVLRL